MVNRCVNPDCKEVWKFFGSGEVYSLELHGTEYSSGGTQFFWLCDSCARFYVVRLDDDGRVVAKLRSECIHVQLPDPHRDLRKAFCFGDPRMLSKVDSAA